MLGPRGMKANAKIKMKLKESSMKKSVKDLTIWT